MEAEVFWLSEVKISKSEAEQNTKEKTTVCQKENAWPEPFHSWFSDVESPKVEKMSFAKPSLHSNY